jgi:phosphoribosylformimino-5-aminoimidazole carboxamide ribotide isomerase
MRLIPAIDLRGGRCVRLYRGRFDAETRYPDEPLQVLDHFRSVGARWIHVVDLDGAKNGVPVNGGTIASMARQPKVRIQAGGGIRSAQIIETLLSSGVARVVIGSLAVQQPVVVLGWLRRFGPERLCLAFDVRVDEPDEPRIYTNGWTEEHGVVLWDALRLYPHHALRHVLCTDIERDGTFAGPNLALYRSAVERFPSIAWQASGGVRDAADLAALARLGVSAAISGRALIERHITCEELRPFLPDESSPASTYATAR